MAQVHLKRKAKIEQDGPDVVVSFECTNEEQADRLVKSIGLGQMRGSVRFSVVIQEGE